MSESDSQESDLSGGSLLRRNLSGIAFQHPPEGQTKDDLDVGLLNGLIFAKPLPHTL